ncbi:MAG TPA: hypothetical protein VJK48_04105 [Chlamydiales bacterium]|nr:MAG: hypothetical protein A3F67_03010 [Verrucomicrobia bacterium RIFCSPHIGHO2_12_FULL_41_10]HLB52870.1 hypothetical protein [Chlamydiales bacterium]
MKNFCLFLTVLFSTVIYAEEESLSNQLERYNRLLQKQDALCKEKKQLTESILSSMSSEMVETSQLKAIREQKLSIRTSLEEARTFGATKMVEQVDKEKIEDLYLSGVSVPGVKLLSHLSVKSKKKSKLPPKEDHKVTSEKAESLR